MQQLALDDLYEKGLRGFDSLSAAERDVFVVHDANLYFEMEGSLLEYVTNGLHAPEVKWLTNALKRIGDSKSSEVLSRLLASKVDDYVQGELLSSEFYALLEERWALIEANLKQQGLEVAW